MKHAPRYLFGAVLATVLLMPPSASALTPSAQAVTATEGAVVSAQVSGRGETWNDYVGPEVNVLLVEPKGVVVGSDAASVPQPLTQPDLRQAFIRFDGMGCDAFTNVADANAVRWATDAEGRVRVTFQVSECNGNYRWSSHGIGYHDSPYDRYTVEIVQDLARGVVSADEWSRTVGYYWWAGGGGYVKSVADIARRSGTVRVCGHTGSRTDCHSDRPRWATDNTTGAQIYTSLDNVVMNYSWPTAAGF